MAFIDLNVCKTKTHSQVAIAEGQLLVDPSDDSVSFDYKDTNNVGKRVTISASPLSYGSTEPTTDLIANKTVWIG